MNILMTGCGSSVGSYIRQQLLGQGHRVFGVGLDGPDLKVDFLTRDFDSENVFKQAEKVFQRGQVRCLINNAAITRIDWTGDHRFSDFEDVLRVNLEIPFQLCSIFVQRLKDMGVWKPTEDGMPKDCRFGGPDPLYRIINISTMGSKIALRGSHGYCASKAGLEMMTRVIAKETAGILPLMACAIRPNGIEGAGMTEYTLQQVMRTRNWSREKAEAYNRNTPLGRNMLFEELWRLVDYTVNRAPLFSTGMTYDFPGGNGL